MKRRLLNLLTAVSLFLTIAVVVLWVRSHLATDQFACTRITVRPGGFRTEEYTVSTRRGVLGIGTVRHNFQQASMPAELYSASRTVQRVLAAAAQPAGERARGGV